MMLVLLLQCNLVAEGLPNSGLDGQAVLGKQCSVHTQLFPAMGVMYIHTYTYTRYIHICIDID